MTEQFTSVTGYHWWVANDHLCHPLVRMDDVIAMLNDGTDGWWYWEHTGGGCMAIAHMDREDASSYDRILVTDGEGPLTEGQTVAEAEGYGGWMIGVYVGESDGDPLLCCPTASLLATARLALTAYRTLRSKT